MNRSGPRIPSKKEAADLRTRLDGKLAHLAISPTQPYLAPLTNPQTARTEGAMKTRAEIASDVAKLVHDCHLSAEQKARVFAGLADDIRERVIADVAQRMERASAARWTDALRVSATVTIDTAGNRVCVAETQGSLVLVWEDDHVAVPANSLDTVTVQPNGYRQWYIAGPTRGGYAVLRDPENVIAS